MIHRMK